MSNDPIVGSFTFGAKGTGPCLVSDATGHRFKLRRSDAEWVAEHGLLGKLDSHDAPDAVYHLIEDLEYYIAHMGGEEEL